MHCHRQDSEQAFAFCHTFDDDQCYAISCVLAEINLLRTGNQILTRLLNKGSAGKCLSRSDAVRNKQVQQDADDAVLNIKQEGCDGVLDGRAGSGRVADYWSGYLSDYQKVNMPHTGGIFKNTLQICSWPVSGGSLACLEQAFGEFIEMF